MTDYEAMLADCDEEIAAIGELAETLARMAKKAYGQIDKDYIEEIDALCGSLNACCETLAETYDEEAAEGESYADFVRGEYAANVADPDIRAMNAEIRGEE